MAKGVVGVIANSALIHPEFYEEGKDLRIIARWGVGYEKVNLDVATQHGVIVTVSSEHMDTVAEYAIAQWMATIIWGATSSTANSCGSLLNARPRGATLRGLVVSAVLPCAPDKRYKGERFALGEFTTGHFESVCYYHPNLYKSNSCLTTKRAIEEGLNEDGIALFDLLKKDDLAKAERERVKQASRNLLASLKARLAELDRFWEKEQTKADVEVFILNEVYASLPTPL